MIRVFTHHTHSCDAADTPPFVCQVVIFPLPSGAFREDPFPSPLFSPEVTSLSHTGRRRVAPISPSRPISSPSSSGPRTDERTTQRLDGWRFAPPVPPPHTPPPPSLRRPRRRRGSRRGGRGAAAPWLKLFIRWEPPSSGGKGGGRIPGNGRRRPFLPFAGSDNTNKVGDVAVIAGREKPAGNDFAQKIFLF